MKIIFMGTPDFAVPCLDALVKSGYDVAAIVTQPDKPFGRKQSQLKPPPVKEAALKHGIKTILQPVKVRTPEFLDAIKELEPDLIVTAAYGRILTKDLLDVPRMGCINVHGSLLPKYRGAAPIQWALINGDSVTGITTIFMDEGMDTGDILLQKKIEITPNMSCQELYVKLEKLGAETLLETIQKLEKGTLKRTIQDHSKAVNVAMMKKEMGLINWNKRAVEIHNLVRGTNPWPGAYTFYKGERLKVWKTALFGECPEKSHIESPEKAPERFPVNSPVYSQEADLNEIGKTVQHGKVLKIFKENMVVATGDGCIKISELQFENCRRMGICECGHNMDEGEVLG